MYTHLYIYLHILYMYTLRSSASSARRPSTSGRRTASGRWRRTSRGFLFLSLPLSSPSLTFSLSLSLSVSLSLSTGQATRPKVEAPARPRARRLAGVPEAMAPPMPGTRKSTPPWTWGVTK